MTIDKESWFLKFDEEDTEEKLTIDETKPEGEIKRKRGRPRKYPEVTNKQDRKIQDLPKKPDKRITDNRFAEMDQIDINKTHEIVEFTTVESFKSDETDRIFHALLTKINTDPPNYEEAMQNNDRKSWQSAINDELNSMIKNQVWKIVDRPTTVVHKRKANIIDSPWVFKRRQQNDGSIKYKARLVVRGFKDTNQYDLSERYAPVSRLHLIRSVMAIVNKFNLYAYHLDVKTAFLNGTIDDNIYMEIPQGTSYSETTTHSKVCKLERAIYGLKISPKRWNERFTKVPLQIRLQNNDSEPCFFTLKNGSDQQMVILMVYFCCMLTTFCWQVTT